MVSSIFYVKLPVWKLETAPESAEARSSDNITTYSSEKVLKEQ
jgi:hypothetical protein